MSKLVVKRPEHIPIHSNRKKLRRSNINAGYKSVFIDINLRF